MTVIDVNEQDFEQEVIERSRTTPVVVDFWAEWCAPCRALGPLLEKAAAAREGDVVLAKLDTDANPSLAQAFGIQGIPAVKAFKDGRVVDEFVGVQPPAQVERFFDGLVPSEADAALPLAGLLHRRGQSEEAQAVLANVSGSFAADGLAARMRLEQADDLDLGEAFKALDDGETERAIDLLIEALSSSDGHKDDVRRVVVGALDELGVDHPLARDARRRLAAALY
jgi:putative thioredoxin